MSINQGRLQFVGTPREFRHSVSVQETVEVAGANLDGLAQRLQQFPGVSYAAHNGTLRRYANGGFSLLRDVVSVLDYAGVKATVSMVEPSLEDALGVVYDLWGGLTELAERRVVGCRRYVS